MRVALNAIFVINKNVEDPSKRNFYLNIIFLEPIEGEIREFLRKQDGSSDGEGPEKMEAKLIFV